MGGKILSAAILIACVPLSTASAQLGKDASYFCIVEAAGGIAYDQQTKKWIGTAFRANRKFVLHLKYLRTRVEKNSGRDDTVYDYNVSATLAGKDFAVCIEDLVPVYEDGLVCGMAGVQEFQLNLMNNRFQLTYALGYVYGKDDKDSTPGIEAGTCTKID